MDRRQFLFGSMAAAAAGGLSTIAPVSASTIRHTTIPSSGETIPAIGLGTYRTFHVGAPREREHRVQLLQQFLHAGGGMVDSSPMYGLSEEVIGHCLDRIPDKGNFFSATKVWTPGRGLGISQMRNSIHLWGVERFDLMQIHNLVDWETHIETLKDWRSEGRIRYLGVTTSHGRKHPLVLRILETQPIDFVQLTYNPVDREAEARLLPAARANGIAVIVNRPFQQGTLLSRLEGKALPPLAASLGCETWAAFCLKFITSHPAVTCAIPATSDLEHLAENMAAGVGPVPSSREREAMIGAARDALG